MKIEHALLPLYEVFIKESETGKRRKTNGERIKKESTMNYRYAYQLLVQFCQSEDWYLRGCDVSRLTTREYLIEKKYWKNFYLQFTNFLYKKKDCHDNYVGNIIKYFRTFINYLRKEKNINIGEFYKDFYVRREEVDILVLNPDQLRFLIHDSSFEQQLTPNELFVKDVFVFGSSTGLRFSDIHLLTIQQFEILNGSWYLKLRTKKTKTFTMIKLADFAVAIFMKYKSKQIKKPIFPLMTLFNFNKHLKKIGEKAGWVHGINHKRGKLGIQQKVKKGSSEKNRFCDFMSSHMMRRTAITSMLILGMPEHLVRNVSGHTKDSSSFFRYVHYAQSFLDQEILKVHETLGKKEDVPDNI